MVGSQLQTPGRNIYLSVLPGVLTSVIYAVVVGAACLLRVGVYPVSKYTE